MAGPLTFIKQSLRDFKNVGAIAPSSVFLARAMARQLPHPVPENYAVLEVGPGTGSFTREIARRMNGRGTLDCWEIGPAFCEALTEAIATETVFAPCRQHIHVHLGDVRTLEAKPRYNAIVSGLPFNNFSADEVRSFLEHFERLLKPQGTLVWFEYVALRRLKQPFVSRARREQLRAIADVLHGFICKHKYRQEIVPVNLPPARVRHLQFV